MSASETALPSTISATFRRMRISSCCAEKMFPVSGFVCGYIHSLYTCSPLDFVSLLHTLLHGQSCLLSLAFPLLMYQIAFSETRIQLTIPS